MILIISFALSFYLHSRSDDDVIAESQKSDSGLKKKPKHKKTGHKNDEITFDIPEPVNVLINPSEDKGEVELKVNENIEPQVQEPIIDADSPEEPNQSPVELPQDDVGDSDSPQPAGDIKKWRLEELDPSDYTDWPKLVDVPGNYEARPPIPAIGSAGHNGDNTGEGGMSPISLNSEEQKLVKNSLSLWGFNLIASDKVNMDRVPADLRMSGKHFRPRP